MKKLASRLLTSALLATMIAACASGSYGDPNVPAAGTVLGTVVHTRDAEELRYVVLKELADRYAEEKGISATPEEVQSYVRHVQETLRRDRERQAARRDEFTRRLAAGGLSETERKSLVAELDTVNRTIEALAPSGGAVPDPEETRAREQVAAAFISQWKINQALYQQYGGRIIFQQGGPEPLDAYRRFLEEAQRKGDFRIVNKELEAAFWRYYRDDSIHSFYPAGSREEAQAFAAPPWQSK
jgi:hypothetical protein